MYLRRCDGSAAVRLGTGDAYDLSHDGRWALATTTEPPSEILVLPTGAGSLRKFPLPMHEVDTCAFTMDAKSVAVLHDEDMGSFLSLLSLETGRWKKWPLPGFGTSGIAFSPDGKLVAYLTREGKVRATSLSDGGIHDLPGPPAARNDYLVQWSADGRFLSLADFHALPARISRREVATGQTTLERELLPAESAGVIRIHIINVAPDGSYAYSYHRAETADLFVADGLK